MKEIKITCEGTEYIDYKELIPFQDEIKILNNHNRKKLEKSIIKYGFSVPAFIWENDGKKYILDAHMRKKVLESLEKNGWKIPLIPAVKIFAKDVKEAKEKLLHITSTYGDFILSNIEDFIIDNDLDLSIMNDTVNIKEIDNILFTALDEDLINITSSSSTGLVRFKCHDLRANINNKIAKKLKDIILDMKGELIEDKINNLIKEIIKWRKQ